MIISKNEKIENTLACPICKEKMKIENFSSGVLHCEGVKKHSYDFSSSGYVNLTPAGKSNAGDSKQAVNARSIFLNKGYYDPIAQKLCELLKKYCSPSSVVVDAGCGEGYYSNIIAREGFLVEGFDLSKFAIDAAAKRAKIKCANETFFAVSSVYSLPLKCACADAVVNIFAPCVEEEYSRVMKDSGVLIVVYAGAEHLIGLKNSVYEKTTLNEERADLPQRLREVERVRLQYDIALNDNETVQNLFAMTPYYWKTSKEDFKKLEMINSLATKIDILFSVYKK